MDLIKIKLVDENTDLSNINPIDWDVVIKGQPYYVCRLEGYYHSIGGTYGNNCYWCYPRNEHPTFENLLQFNGAPVRWGFTFDDNNYKRFKYGEGEVLHNHIVTITRNGEPFYDFGCCGVAYGVGKAMEIIESIDEHPLEFNSIDFDKKMIGRKVWFRDYPAIISRYVTGQACVLLEPDGIDKFPKPKCFNDDDMYYEDTDVKLEIFSENIWWFRD